MFLSWSLGFSSADVALCLFDFNVDLSVLVELIAFVVLSTESYPISISVSNPALSVLYSSSNFSNNIAKNRFKKT